ncbi:MAG: polymer-forming cytoskeletal protein [Caldilinea sp. CFX5]|nr:polymer-forming cytoskeletal protein [Caldilinea sp. CFX5]
MPGPVQFTAQGDKHAYSEDVVVETGEVFDHDVIVYSGDVTVEEDGLIKGDLVAYSGDVTIAAGGKVQGDVTAVSGDVQIDGAVGGDLVVWSGDIDLAETAKIGGNASVMSGAIHREEGAVVQGNLLRGNFSFPQLPPLLESLQLPAIPALPAVPAEPAMPAVDTAIQRSQDWSSALFGLLGRLFLAAFGSSLIVLLAGLVFYARPALVQTVEQTLHEQRPLSFAIGLIVNLVLVVLTVLLVATLCLAPVGLAVGVLFAAINLVGWSALALTVGDWLLRRARLENQPLVALIIGAFVLTGLLSLGWALGGCLRPLAYVMTLLVTSFGSGAVVVYWLRLRATPKTAAPIVPA